MKKAMFLLAACVATAAIANVALADDLALWFDERGDYAEIATPVAPYVNNPGGGVAGDAQIAYVSPQLPGGEHIFVSPTLGTLDWSLASLTLYADFNAAAGNVLSSLGLDIAIGSPADASETGLDTLTFTAWNDPADVGGGLTDAAWDGYSVGTWTVNGGSFKAVQVPVTDNGSGPAFDVATGLVAGDGYRLGTLDFQAAARADSGDPVNGPFGIGYLEVSMSVNGLLITQVNDAGTAANLDLYFGYAGGSLEAATGNGITEGATSATADAVIQTRMKGDFTEDGRVNNLDIQNFLIARETMPVDSLPREDVYLGDFNGDNLVNNLDIQAFLANRDLP